VVATAAAGVVGGLVGTQLADSDGGPVAAEAAGTEPVLAESAPPARAPESVAGIAQQALPSVVSIATSGGTGSGFVITEDGYIVTNHHVVADAGADGVRVSLRDGREVAATVVGTSPAYDLAVLDVDLTGLTPLPLGDSAQVVVGDPVVAVGNPLGLEGTVTAGIVSAVDRPVTAGGQDEVSFINAIQTDAAINPGNSGGPLLDASGQVVGVNSSIATLGVGATGQGGSIGLGFAIPINQARLTAEEIIADGEATFPVIGATLDVSTGQGAVIASVVPAGPAEGAGLRPGDVVTSIDGTTVRTSEELIVAIRSRQPGDTVELTYERGGSEGTVTLQLDSSVG
jgi:putative serine protease PepD